MKKIIYWILLLTALGLTGYTGYTTYTTYTTSTSQPITVATSTEQVVTPSDTKNTFTTKTGKQIRVKETNPAGQSLSTLTINSLGFTSTSSIVIEKNKLTNIYLSDINNDSYEELIIITQAQGSGSYSDATIYTTGNETELTPVVVPNVSEDDTKQGGLFYDYMGHDIFTLENNTLTRRFPIYTKTDTNNKPTGGNQTVIYTLINSAGLYSVQFTHQLSTTSPVTIQSASTTDQLSGTSWIFKTSTATGTKELVAVGSKFVLVFDTSKNFTSTTDCNSVGGTYTTNNTSLLFGAFVSTMMFCENAKETIYTGLLSKTYSYAVQGDTLTLSLSNKSTMTFKKK